MSEEPKRMAGWIARRVRVRRPVANKAGVRFEAGEVVAVSGHHQGRFTLFDPFPGRESRSISRVPRRTVEFIPGALCHGKTLAAERALMEREIKHARHAVERHAPGTDDRFVASERRRLARAIADWEALIADARDDRECVRAGDVPCDACGKLYSAHSRDPEQTTPDHEGVERPFLFVACDGRRIKL